jgi:hypothetical protein
MVRSATVEDAEQLYILNEQFNGKGDNSMDNIKDSLSNNKQEFVVIAEESGILVGQRIYSRRGCKPISVMTKKYF